MPIDLQRLKDFATRLQAAAQQDPATYGPMLDRTNALIERAVKTPYVNPHQVGGQPPQDPQFPELGRVMQVSEYGQPKFDPSVLMQPPAQQDLGSFSDYNEVPRTPAGGPVQNGSILPSPIAPPSDLESIFQGPPRQQDGQWPAPKKPWYDFTPLDGGPNELGSFSDYNQVATDPKKPWLPAPNGPLFDTGSATPNLDAFRKKQADEKAAIQARAFPFGRDAKSATIEQAGGSEGGGDAGGSGRGDEDTPYDVWRKQNGVEQTRFPTPQEPRDKSWGWQDFMGLLLGGRNFLQHKQAENTRLDYEDRADARHRETLDYRKESDSADRKLRDDQINVDYLKASMKPEIEEDNRLSREEGNLARSVASAMNPENLKNPIFQQHAAAVRGRRTAREQALLERAEAEQKKKVGKTETKK
jgi:hypothetical protein